MTGSASATAAPSARACVRVYVCVDMHGRPSRPRSQERTSARGETLFIWVN